MKKILTIILVVCFVFQTGIVLAAGTKQDWQDRKEIRAEKNEVHTQAKLDYQNDRTDKNNQLVIDSGKDLLNALLDEVEVWLLWQESRISQDDNVSVQLKEKVSTDVNNNLSKIKDLKDEVDAVQTKIQLGVISLKMVGSYLELLVDVARNSGLAWVEVGENLIEISSGYEEKLRAAAEVVKDNEEIISKLDLAESSVVLATTYINDAKDQYNQVVMPGTPLVKFGNGNKKISQARLELNKANQLLIQSLEMIIKQ
jgi:hypothetical protein